MTPPIPRPEPGDAPRRTPPIDDEVRRLRRGSVLCWLATVGDDGMPSVSPKEVWALHGDDEVLVAHIASPHTVRHLRRHPLACLSFVDVFVQKGFKLQGEAEVVEPSAAAFAALAAPLEAMTQGRFTIRAVIRLRVRTCTPIVAPSYRFFPHTTEAAQVDAALRTYGVTRASPG